MSDAFAACGSPDSVLLVCGGTRSKPRQHNDQPHNLLLASITRAVHRRGIAVLPSSQSGSGKTRLVRSAQLRHIWRDAANIGTSVPTEEMKEGDLEQHDGKGDLDWLGDIDHCVKSPETIFLHGLSLGGAKPCTLNVLQNLPALTPNNSIGSRSV